MFRFRVVDGIFSVIHQCIPWLGAACLAYVGYLSVEALAGQTTAASIGVNILGNLQLGNAIAWLVGASGLAYGYQQRKLRKDEIERLAERNRRLEHKIDPKRSSSELTKRGDSRKEDGP